MAAPIATYRVQLTGSFGFADVARIVPYLRDLGISHLYASPILKARAGSTHGYDVVDPTQLNPELGGDAGFARLAAALGDAGIGLIVDFVPNHMGVHHADNPWWLDVLEWGPASPYACAFDIEWPALPNRSRPGVMIPVLGRPYGEALAAGDVALRYDARDGSFSAWYFEHRLPIAPATYRGILRRIVRCAGTASAPSHAIVALTERTCGYGHPTRGEAPAFKAALAAIPGSGELIRAGLGGFSGKTEGGMHALHRLLERQHWRLAHWRLASREINYRRFFDINTLAGLRVEDAAVFRELHARMFALIGEGAVTGLRLDHIDGLADPAGYFQTLHDRIAELAPRTDRPLPVIVEKILGPGERLPRFAGVMGTTGYEWLNVISQILLDPRGMPALDRAWREANGEDRPFGQIVAGAKREVLQNLLASELNTLSRLLARIAAGDSATRDFADDRLRAALERYIIALPIYRTYVTPDGASADDRAVIARALAAARDGVPDADGPIFDFLHAALTFDLVAPGHAGYSRRRLAAFVRKLQQLTGPVMAKSLEDTAFYRYHRLLALNEVGGDPASPGLSVDTFHRAMQARIASGAPGLTATATHDTKRGEDARARLLALSEIPDQWAAATAAWRAENARFVRHLGGRRSPSAAHEYMLYQALLGTWPVEGDRSGLAERFQAFARKAAREGKQETSWLDPDDGYEQGLADFIDSTLGDRAFTQSFDAFAQRVALLGALNALTQVALKVAMPGIPDFYQGTEFWDLSLVDPDNRRPVDFMTRQRLLAQPDEAEWPALAEAWRDGRIKFAVMRRLLAWRRGLGDVLVNGDYRPLTVAGPHREHVVAFARVHGDVAAALVVGRHFAPLTDGGRHWPCAAAWQGEVVLDGVIDGFALAGRAEPSGRVAALALSALFDPVPLAFLSATRARTSARR